MRLARRVSIARRFAAEGADLCLVGRRGCADVAAEVAATGLRWLGWWIRHWRCSERWFLLAKNGGNPRLWIDRADQDRAGNVAYGSAKAGVHAITLYVAKELAADAVAYLAGEQASFTTGEILDVNGGAWID